MASSSASSAKRPRSSPASPSEAPPCHFSCAYPSPQSSAHADFTTGADERNNYDGDEDALMLSQTDNPSTPITQGGWLQRGRANEPKRRQRKTIHDRVHGPVQLDGLLVAVMDTPEFQRLGQIKQLGGCAFVYPSATHSRKEHSIGVAHLARIMVEHLRAEQPELRIDADDVLCIELAGLVHDLGHGPFSHMFETFMSRVRREGEAKWEHELMSASLLERLICRHRVPLELYFSQGADTQAQVRFVSLLIRGISDSEVWPEDVGRGEDKRFLCDIVANKRSGIDVDKLDYLVRDSMAAFGAGGRLPGFDIHRIITSSRVLTRRERVGSPRFREVCFQMKVALDINMIYQLRAMLHRQVYQHRMANVAEAMITDLLEAANPYFLLRGTAPGQVVSLSEAARDPDCFVRLTDGLLESINTQPNQDGLAGAQRLYERLQQRNFYRQIGSAIQLETRPRCRSCEKPSEIEAAFCQACGKSLKVRRHEMQGGVQVPVLAALTAEKAREAILATVDETERERLRPKLLCHIVDIKHGTKTTREDPFGRRWVSVQPLTNVGFFNPKDVVEEGADFQVQLIAEGQVHPNARPKINWSRTLYCYLKESDEDEDEDELMAQLESLLADWKTNVAKTSDQLGGENPVSPSPFKSRDTQKSPSGLKPRRNRLEPRTLGTMLEEGAEPA